MQTYMANPDKIERKWYVVGYGNGSDDGPDDERQYAE